MVLALKPFISFIPTIIFQIPFADYFDDSCAIYSCLANRTYLIQTQIKGKIPQLERWISS